ncbi:MAG: TrbG/VirB9 family P-type conjugative transfer protein [Spirochaetia bacterium]|uniref:TrbG/VirB9 family P-type conjugative transfer protein n=1 Tax=Candidatus Treponema excrementipullorum TaxID=2838768 RepID=A0A9E2L2T5_9SPIR|nr:TrbG/VirB9 family P-type conjugative transfer protein [Candidatus Treponema excrementipullorum]MCI6480491.1 TrbG/VirB9 family P-type conjugative transfer protein [Spirochaetia bacterium]
MKKIFILLLSIFFVGCKTVDLEELNSIQTEVVVVEEQAEVDFSKAVIFLDSPEVREVEDKESTTITGQEALIANLKDITVLPEYFDGRLKGWIYKEGSVYQVITQTYHSTLILFEPGEVILETPYVSEPDVWRFSRGIGLKNGVPQHHLLVKPDYSNLNSTLVVVTDRRVYQMELVSTKTTYMPTVQWLYPQTIADGETWKQYQEEKLFTEEGNVRRDQVSFDYKMRHSVFKIPTWLPTQVYDDGQRTYIILNDKSLLTEYPAVFNEKNEIINYRVKDNIIIIDNLIEKVTLNLDGKKVTIEKKKDK